MSAMDLDRLLEGIATVPPGETPKITGLALDSRRVRRGDLFLALPGMAADGRDFVGDAVASGASAVAYESGDGQAASGSPVPTIAVADLRDQLGRIADRFYGAPSRKLVVIGVTGTNGKTTCTHLLAQAMNISRASEPTSPLPLRERGRERGNVSAPLPPTPIPSPARGEGSEPLRAQSARCCAVIGTLGYGFPGALDASRHTTPDALTVHRLMREFLEAGASYVALEVSSHALDQGRVNAVAFDVAVFTNLTRDHLDYHGDMSAYGVAKAGLFGREGLRCAVINQDDAFGQDLLTRFRGRLKTLSYGLHGGDVTARSVTPTRSGLKLEVTTPQGDATLDSSLVGRFNAYNLLAVLATLLLLDVPLPEACARLQRARSPAGRAEHFGGRSGRPLVIVDYAHTPDALEQILRVLREHTPGRLICVFGCGGDRDRGKRPLMGGIAERLADRVILTDDNPRTEAPERILDDIRAGMRQPARTVRDRRAAIAAALAEATPEDIVLVAGKGHEDYQQVGETRLPYSDREAVRQLLGAAA
jgi:UDP-N-acetylmuramoyl-L-alanyl-D-glutamate--2,6-diaminopimelate ligase